MKHTVYIKTSKETIPYIANTNWNDLISCPITNNQCFLTIREAFKDIGEDIVLEATVDNYLIRTDGKTYIDFPVSIGKIVDYVKVGDKVIKTCDPSYYIDIEGVLEVIEIEDCNIDEELLIISDGKSKFVVDRADFSLYVPPSKILEVNSIYNDGTNSTAIYTLHEDGTVKCVVLNHTTTKCREVILNEAGDTLVKFMFKYPF